MSDHPEEPDSGSEEGESKRRSWNKLLHKGLAKGKDEWVKGKIVLQKSLGLGPKPNAVPDAEADVAGDMRTVEIGWHPVAGFAGKWLAERTGLGKKITEKINKYPDPTQHWAVLVGDYCHELWMDEHLDIIYINEKINREEWTTFEVGKTRFNDQALKETGEMVIHNMREARAGYNLISNNCQNFAVNLLDVVQLGAHREFATAFAVYQKATGKGRIKDLFLDQHPEEQASPPRPGIIRHDTVHNAQQVMMENTTQLDNHTTCLHAH
ncbi:hypothetical protein H072_6413 [Dactylellina haptotyla CBS 200.50]|uniref:Uncharacterized protein n=1 Tax=Dactylellina haptotyla (strain CBS 200.50) TaxID=1284197 RepID=S8AAC5_DACHA|nr:hypothetical protein H072_6413 [Dactylellina haptotyla CBS 200.50]